MGYESDELASLNLRDVLHPDFAEETLKKFERIKNGEKIADFETVFRRKDGRRLYLSGSVNCRLKEIKPLHFVVFSTTQLPKFVPSVHPNFMQVLPAAINSTNLDDLYSNIHKELGEVIDVKTSLLLNTTLSKAIYISLLCR
jgi:PAS domain-containing protein